MISNEECIRNFETIFDDVKFSTNSIVRLKVLAALFARPQTMKDVTDTTNIGYSSVSSTIHDLELKNWVFRDHNKYYLTNTTRFCIENILELNRVIYLINEFFNILDGHIVDVLPIDSILELYLLGNATLLESGGVDVYKIYNFIEACLEDVHDVKCVMPFFYDPFVERLNDLISKNENVEIYVPENICEDFSKKSKIKNLNSFSEKESFLLIVTENEMIIGFFMENGFFDQNRVLTSKNSDALKWANNLFENFKNEN